MLSPCAFASSLGGITLRSLLGDNPEEEGCILEPTAATTVVCLRSFIDIGSLICPLETSTGSDPFLLSRDCFSAKATRVGLA